MAYTCVRVIFEIGHEAIVREKKTVEGYTHNWELYIRGADNTDIQHFVDKVVFYLHKTFPNPKRTVKEPPFSIRETGYAGFNVLVEVYLKNRPPAEPNKIRFNYFLNLQDVSQPPLTKVVKEKYIFSNPTQDFRRNLIKGGGVGVNAESSSSLHPSHLSALNSSHSVDEHKNSIIRNKSPQEIVPAKKSKKDSIQKHEEIDQNEFSKLFGQPIIKNKTQYSSTLKSSSKSMPDKLLQQSDKQGHSSLKTSKHNSSLHKDKDHDKEKERDRNKGKVRERDKKEKSSIKKVKDDGAKKEKSKDDGDKILRASKEESKKNSYQEDKSKEKDKSVQNFEKEINLDKKEKEKKHKDEKIANVKQKYNNNENKKENLGLQEDYTDERVDKTSVQKDVNSVKEEKRTYKNVDLKEDKLDKINRDKFEPKSVYNNGSVNNSNLNNAPVVNTFESFKKEEKHKHHKHKKDKSKKDSKRDKEEKKEKVKECKESKEKSTTTLVEHSKLTPKTDSPRRQKRPLKKLFEELIENSDSDASSLDEDIKVLKMGHPESEPECESSSSEVAQQAKVESPIVFSNQAQQSYEARLESSTKRKSKKLAEEKEVKKRKRKSKYKDGENVAKLSKHNDTDGSTKSMIKQNSMLGGQDSSVESMQSMLPISESRFTDEYITKLKELQRKIMSLEDHSGLQKIVQVVAETGQYEITTKTFDFDLCSLDESIVQRLLDFFVP